MHNNFDLLMQWQIEMTLPHPLSHALFFDEFAEFLSMPRLPNVVLATGYDNKLTIYLHASKKSYTATQTTA